MKTLISAFILLALAAPGAHAQTAIGANGWNVGQNARVEQIPIDPNSSYSRHVIVCGDYNIPDSLSGVIGCSHPHADAVSLSQMDMALAAAGTAYEVQPTTLPILEFSKGHRWVHVSGVALADGQPVPGATVNVIAELDGGFSKYAPAVTDARGVYNVWFQAPSAIRSVRADVQSFCSTGAAADCMENYSIGNGGTVPVGMNYP